MNPVLSRMNTYIRDMMVCSLSGRLPLYIVNEYPKSGGTWVGQMLGKALNIPFPRNRFPKFEKSIIHGHYLHPRNMKHVVIVWRDGRDVMTSWYYHCLFPHEYYNDRLVKITRNALLFKDYEDVKNNMPQFIEYVFTRQKNPNFSWSDFVRVWHNHKNAVHVRYEDIRNNTDEELKRIVSELTWVQLSPDAATDIAEEFSFSRQKKRKSGFMRKGIVGDWRNHFTPEAKELFNFYAGDCLIQMGYEKNQKWVKES